MSAPTTVPVRVPPSTGVGPVRTVANVVTVLRTVVAVVVAGAAVGLDRPLLLVPAYAVYWVGDVLDGYAARRLGQETRLGAVLDIVSDRACTSILCVGLVAQLPQLGPVVVAFFLCFMVLDTMLSLSFLCFPLLGPNYFGQVDQRVYLLNWSPAAKALNTAGVVVLLLAGQTLAAAVLVALLVGVKVWSGARVLRLVEAR